MKNGSNQRFIPNTDADRAEMLKVIGVEKFEDLISNLPDEVIASDWEGLANGLSEFEVMKELSALASRNLSLNESISFAGGGSYDHYVPSLIGEITGRSEYLTAYTPYQPEVAQGTLQAIFEYQSMICALTGMDVTNASMYDGASALAEAALLAMIQTRRDKLIIASAVNPTHVDVIKTYVQGRETTLTFAAQKDGVVDIDALAGEIDDSVAAVIIQSPNFYGCIEDGEAITKIAHENGALMIVSADPISLGILKRPGDYDVDIVVGEGQSLGSPPQFGGPYLGIFGAKKALVRRMPGRIVGQTRDVDGKRGYVLTLQTREQHIRRERATSNICTNEGIVMLAATVYMALMGKEGLTRVAELSTQNSHYLADKITALDGYELAHDAPFFKEFVIKTPVPAAQVIERLLEDDIIAGIDISQYNQDDANSLLIAVTEKKTKAEMDTFTEKLSSIN